MRAAAGAGVQAASALTAALTARTAIVAPALRARGMAATTATGFVRAGASLAVTRSLRSSGSAAAVTTLVGSSLAALGRGVRFRVAGMFAALGRSGLR